MASMPSIREATLWSGWLWLAAGAALGATALLAGEHANSWYFFAEAADLLSAGPETEGSGLDLYRARPDLQFGPLVVVVSMAFAALPSGLEVWAVMVGGALAGVLALALVADAVGPVDQGFGARPEGPAERRVLLITGVAFLVAWLRLAAYTAHLDDVIALTALAAAAAAVARRRPGWATLAVAVAIAVKPWAVIFVPLCALGGGQRRLLRPALALVPAALSWLVFLIGSPGTLESLRGFGLRVDVNSGLRALGVPDATAPGWLRPTQLALGLAVTTAVVVRRRSWPTILVAGIAARMLIDPATNHYYTTGFVLAALVWELHEAPTRLPWRTACAALVLEVAARDIELGGLTPMLRFLLLAAVIVAAVGPPSVARARRSRPQRAVQPPSTART